jgi:hypothetical protein
METGMETSGRRLPTARGDLQRIQIALGSLDELRKIGAMHLGDLDEIVDFIVSQREDVWRSHQTDASRPVLSTVNLSRCGFRHSHCSDSNGMAVVSLFFMALRITDRWS